MNHVTFGSFMLSPRSYRQICIIKHVFMQPAYAKAIGLASAAYSTRRKSCKHPNLYSLDPDLKHIASLDSVKLMRAKMQFAIRSSLNASNVPV